MRTITKLRLPLFALLAVIVGFQLPIPAAVRFPAVVAMYLAVGFYAMKVRCPVCGRIAMLRRSPTFGDYYFIGDTCAQCGADFHKV